MLKFKGKRNEASLYIIAICTAIMILMQFSSYPENDVGKDLIFGAYYKPFIVSGEWWRLLSAGFVHGGWIHLLCNMSALYSFSLFMEPLYGKKHFLMLLLLSSIGGYVFMFINQGNVIGVGLSGGLYGLMAAYVYIIVKAGGWNNPTMRHNLLELLFINGLINFLPGIGYMVHVGGFITGLLLAISFDHDPRQKELRKNTLVSLTILIVVCFKMASANLQVPENEWYLGTDANYLNYQVEKGRDQYVKNLANSLDEYYGITYFSVVY